MKRLLILGGPIFQRPIIRKAKQMGLEVGVVDINPDSPVASEADRFFIASVLDKGDVLSIASDFKPDAVISGACDTSVTTTAWLCEQLGLPGIGSAAAHRATDKVEMLRAFESTGVSHPAYQVVRSEEICDFSLKVPYPLITKPTDSAGGRGVNLVQSFEELLNAVRISSAAGKSGDVLVEEYLCGREVSVEVIVADGVPHVLQITDKYTSGAPNFYEIGHSQPAAIDAETANRVAALASAAVLSVGLKNSAAHVEIMITPQGPKMIELGARMGGDCISTYLVDKTVKGIDMAESMINLALGNTLNMPQYENSGVYCSVRFLPSKEGHLMSISGLGSALAVDGVVHAELMARTGVDYLDAVDDSSRFAYVVACGQSLEEANDACCLALNKLVIEMDPLN